MEYLRHTEVVQEASRVGVSRVIVEGPTLYLRESPKHRSQGWGDPAFRRGWEVAHNLSQMLSRDLGAAAGHWVLIDDSLGNPKNFQRDMWRPEPANVVASLREDMGISGFLPNVERVMLESEFAHEAFHLDPYPGIDAGFQVVKLRDNLSELRGLRVVIVHEDSYQRQQQKMLSHLLGAMRRCGDFNWLTHAQRREVIEGSFRHVWINSDGQEVGTTRPQWNKNNGLFDFISLGEVA